MLKNINCKRRVAENSKKSTSRVDNGREVLYIITQKIVKEFAGMENFEHSFSALCGAWPQVYSL